ncbi:MAG: signal peptidase I [Nanoarchaeota archaeon]|nr:signal peptidase I [Nanoarchaeota archaeon]
MLSKRKKRPKKPTTTGGKIWYFIWHDNSVWSWIANIILAFVLIKFIVYPGIGLAFGTTHPIVAVVSGSMEHPGGFDKWWAEPASCSFGACTQEGWYKEHAVSRETFRRFSMKNGFNKGDIIILFGAKPERLVIGDVIVFRSGRPDPIIHRVVKKTWFNDHYLFQTKGDNNPDSITSGILNENGITEDRIIGKAVLRVPWLGWVKIMFVEMIKFIIGWF